MRYPRVTLALLTALASPLLAQVAPLVIPAQTLPFGGLNQNYNAVLMATGGSGSYTWTIASGLPPGLSVDNCNLGSASAGFVEKPRLVCVPGTIFGAPTAVGAFNFSVKVTDNRSLLTATRTLSIGVMQISNPSPLPAASTCGPYSQTFSVSDGPAPPFAWSFDDSVGPPGLTINPTTGVLSGTPTMAGQFGFNIEAFSDTGNIFALQAFSVTIGNLCFLNGSLPNGDVNSFYRQSLLITGGTGPFMWKVTTGGLPPGVTIDPVSGLLSGIPTTPGPYSFTVQVTDSIGSSATQSFSLTINPALAFTTTSPLPPGTFGTNYSQTLAATGGVTPYVFASTNPPPGLALSSAGVLSGPPSVGNFTFTATVTDALNNTASMDFKLVIGTGAPLLQVSPSALTFNAPFGGDAPASKFIDVVPAGTEPVPFHVSVDGGSGVPAPGWISVAGPTTPAAGAATTRPHAIALANATAPARLVVTVNQGAMSAQSSTARILIMDSAGNATIVSVTLNVASGSPQLQVAPDTLHFSARSATPGALTEVLAVRGAGGGGPISFNTSIQGNSSWIAGVTPPSGHTATSTAVFLNVQVNTQGLQEGSYHDVIVFSSSAGTVNVPVALFVSGNGAILGLGVTGVRFQARQGGGFSNPQTVQVLNVGDPASSLSWTTEFVSGSQFFSATPSSGVATLSSPGALVLAPQASALQLAPGGYYGLVKISSVQALNSPLYVVLVLDLEAADSPALPDPSPAGLFFLGTAGVPLTTGQLVDINTSSAAPAAFQVAILTADGGTWLTANPVTGTATGQNPGQITVTADASTLAAGIYSGEVDISMSGALRSVNVILIVLPTGGITALAVPAVAANCNPAKLALVETGLVNNFAVPAGWPAALTVQVYDDCGNSVPNASVTASFSNGDAPLMLHPGQSPNYSSTWQPGVVSPQMTVNIQAQAAQLQPAKVQLIGTINQNQNAPPVLSENGTVNVFNRVPAGALAPGMIIEVYGAGLSNAKGNPGVLPLPVNFSGTSLIVGPNLAPLYFVSGAQLDVQVATELTPNQQYPVIAILNGALSVPVMTDISPVQLGLAALDGHVIAQHGVDSSYVTATSPARPGEVLVVYLSGMGPTNPSVKSGVPAPTSPLAKVTIAPTVTLDGQGSVVQFAGLSPGLVGLYQINFVVPSNANTGDLTLVVTQNGVSSNITRLPVSK